jgi:hypothetical protein
MADRSGFQLQPEASVYSRWRVHSTADFFADLRIWIVQVAIGLRALFGERAAWAMSVYWRGRYAVV